METLSHNRSHAFDIVSNSAEHRDQGMVQFKYITIASCDLNQNLARCRERKNRFHYFYKAFIPLMLKEKTHSFYS